MFRNTASLPAAVIEFKSEGRMTCLNCVTIRTYIVLLPKWKQRLLTDLCAFTVFLLNLTSFYLIIVGAVGYCCT